jgi:hypothetical protein
MWNVLKQSWLWLLGILLPVVVVCLVLFLTHDERVGPFWSKYRRVEIRMTSGQVIAILGPPSHEVRPGGTCGDHFCYWDVPDGTVKVSCDMADIVYDKRAPQETRWERMQRELRPKDYNGTIRRYVEAGKVIVAAVFVFLLPCWLLVKRPRSPAS